MTTFSDEELEKLMRLSRIQCTEDEKAKLKDSLAKILTYIEQLKDIPTEGIEPVRSVTQSLQTSAREDTPCNDLTREVFLANSPSHIGGMIKVPPIMKPTSSSQ
jgi:aspartyl-tRNA(Asn)/glutamyl-tRNA(Gln) amidotransferase subunit C